jgi:hypothetical protein
MTARAQLLLAALLLPACERPRAFVICHNSNCYGPTDPFEDDTIQALRRSLALEWNGQPLVDGVELDSMWDSEAERCAFAHDPSRAASSFSGGEAADEVAAHIRETASLVGDRRFYVKIDMKAVVGPDGSAATAEQSAAHADCVLDMYDRMSAAAIGAGSRLTVFFESEDTGLVDLVTRRPAYPGKNEGADVATGLIVPIGASVPEGLVVDVVSVKSEDITPERGPAFRELRSRGIDIMVWMFDADVGVLASLDVAEPRFVNTNEAALLREWLGPPPAE